MTSAERVSIAKPPVGDDSPGPVLLDLAARLERVSVLPLAEHPDIYQGIHADLQRALADIDDA